MKILLEDEIIHIVFDVLLPHRNPYWSDNPAVYHKCREREIQRINRIIRTEFMETVPEFMAEQRELINGLKSRYGHFVFVYCNYLHRQGDAVNHGECMDTDNLHTNQVTNMIGKWFMLTPDDSPKYQSTYVLASADGDCPSAWLAGREEGSSELSHTELFIVPFVLMKRLFN